MVQRQQEAIAAIAGKVGDPKEATKAQSIVGAVLEAAANKTGGCRVLTEHGVISILVQWHLCQPQQQRMIKVMTYWSQFIS